MAQAKWFNSTISTMPFRGKKIFDILTQAKL